MPCDVGMVCGLQFVGGPNTPYRRYNTQVCESPTRFNFTGPTTPLSVTKSRRCSLGEFDTLGQVAARNTFFPRVTSFHNRQASAAQRTREAPVAGAAPTRNQKEHLRALRARQYRLLQTHSNLPSAEQDMLLEQMRVPFHSERATATLEEFVMDESGNIASPTKPSSAPSASSKLSMESFSSRGSSVMGPSPASAESAGLVGPKRRASLEDNRFRLAPLVTVPENQIMQRVITSSVPSTGHLDGPVSPGGDVLDLLDDEPPRPYTPLAGVAYSDVESPTGSVRGTGDAPLKSHHSLRRLNDFVMVTSNVLSTDNGGIKKQKLVFRCVCVTLFPTLHPTPSHVVVLPVPRQPVFLTPSLFPRPTLPSPQGQCG